jgi:hypothetical protein
MSGYSAHHPGVFIVNFALDDAMAESLIVFCWRNLRPPVCPGIERRGFKSELQKEFLAAESV